MPVLTVERCRPSIRTGEFTDLLRDLRSHELDLVVGEGEPLEAARSGMEVAVIDRPALVAIVGPDIVPRDDWQNLSLLEYRTASAYYWEVDNFLKERGLHRAPMGELDDAFLMLEAAARGGFVASVPRSVAREAIRAGRVRLLATLAPVTAGVHAVYHASDTLHLARMAVEMLIQSARQDLESEVT